MENCLGKYNAEEGLQIDECIVNINYTGNANLKLYAVYDACYKCAYKFCQDLSNGLAVYKTQPEQIWRIESLENGKTSILCDNLKPSFGEFGMYELQIVNNKCEFTTLRPPANIYIPLLIPLGLILVCSVFMILGKYFAKPKGDNTSAGTTEASRRISSIDVFRGITITLMIFVNDGGGGYEFIDHVPWNGLHLADIIFPWFVWIMGFCIPIALHSEYKRSSDRLKIFRHILKRSIILLILGVMMNTVASGAKLETIRIPGVLQRLAVAYFCGAVLYLIFLKRVANANPNYDQFTDILNLLPHWVIVIAICLVHTSIIFFINVPGCPKGYLGPGGWHENGEYFNCTGGVTKYIDELILGKNHMFKWPAIREIYNSSHFEPENILGCLPTVLQVFLGIQAGVTLRSFINTRDRLIRWLSWGAFTLVCSGILCGFQIEDGWIPINKSLWSLSFVLVTSSLGFFTMALCFYVVDEKKLWSGKPFLFMGMNSTLMFLGHMVCYRMFPFHWSLGPMNTHLMVLVENLWSTIIWIIISYFLWKRKLFLKI